MDIRLLGSGCAVPDARRQNTSLLLKSSGARIMVDVHGNAAQAMMQAGESFHDLQHILFTHRHIDHIAGIVQLIENMWVWYYHRERSPSEHSGLHLYANHEAKTHVQALLDACGHSENEHVFPIIWHEFDEMTSLAIEDLSFSFFKTNHGSALCHGFRVCQKQVQSALVYSADTQPMPEIFARCKDGDILIHECSSVTNAEAKYHTTLAQIEGHLESCNAQQIICVHMPNMSPAEEDLITKRLVEKYGKRMLLGYDGQQIFI